MFWHGEPVKLLILPFQWVGRWGSTLLQGAVTHWVLKYILRVGVDMWPLPTMPSQDNGPQMELTRDVWNLDDDQLWEVLEALQMEIARKEGWHPHTGHLKEIWGAWEALVKLRWMTGKWASGVRGWRHSEPMQWPTSPPWPMWMSATSSACSWLDWGRAPPESTPSVMMPLLERPRCLLSSGATRSSVQGPLSRGSGVGE